MWNVKKLTTFLLLSQLWLGTILQQHVSAASSSSSSSAKGLVLRIRLPDGTMEKVALPSGSEETMTVHDVLKPFDVKNDASIQVGQTQVEDSATRTTKPLSTFGIKNGSIITVKAPPSSSSSDGQKPKTSRFAALKVEKHSWDPFPDLAKDYEHAVLKMKTRRNSQKGGSYGDISQLASSLHVLEPQQEGRLKRIYMCRNSAERFHANGIVKKGGSTPLSRAGLLFGTIQRERVESGPRKARTSLSSQTSDSAYCTVAKVQAVWEPPGQKTSGTYDATIAESLLDKNQRVLDIADYLGLVPVGWIFTYQDKRHDDEDDALPVFGLDVHTGAKLQISNMRSKGIVDGAKFATLAMDANTGATEAFQLSDVSVQMVHEGVLLVTNGESKRHVATKNPVMVDGKQSHDIDSVLCLINTAMLSHVGSFSGKSAANSVKKNGSLTKKTKTALLNALDNDHNLLEALCDLNVLVALDQSLSDEDTAELCQLVRKWSRGQKQGTEIAAKLKMQLKGVLET